MPFARASELDRLLACPGSLVLPREETKSERAIEAAAYGTAAHYWKETGKFSPGKPGDAVGRKVKASGVDRDSLWPGGLHEVPLAYNVNTGEALALVLPLPDGEKAAWKASFGDEWIVGTADFVGQLMDTPWVDDLKTGRHVEWDSYKYQQSFYVLAWSLFGEHDLLPARSTLTHWPKYPLPKKPERFGRVLEVDYLQGFKTQLRNLWVDYQRLKETKERGMDVSPRLTAGDQCFYCPSKLSCIKGLKNV